MAELDNSADSGSVSGEPQAEPSSSLPEADHVSGRHLAALTEISQVLVTAVGFGDAIEHVIATVARALSIESGGILLADHEAGDLVLQAPAFGRMNDLSGGPTRISLAGRSNSVAVFKSGRPYLSNDARNDPAILQSFVDAYGTRSILTVPLQIAGRSIGVFHAVNKVTGGFSNDDVEFLSLIAPHLAIIVRSSEMMRVLRTQHREMEGVLEIESTLNGAFLAGSGLAGLTETLANLLHSPVALTDEAGRVLAFSTVGNVVVKHALATLCRILSTAAGQENAFSARSGPARLSLNDRNEMVEAVVLPVLVRGERVGYLAALATPAALGNIQVRALRQAVALFAVEITKGNEVYEIERRLQVDVIDGLLAATSESEAMRLFRRIAADLQFPIRAGFLQLSETALREVSHGHASYHVRLHRALRAALLTVYQSAEVVPYRDGFVLLLPSPAAPDLHTESDDLANALAAMDESMGVRRASYQVGLGKPVSSPARIVRSFEEALAVIAMAAELGHANSALLVEQLDVYRLFLSPTRERDVNEYVDGILGDLVAYDRDHGTDLTKFLRALVQANFNASRVARLLSVHLNTAKYRRRRIEALLGGNLDNPDVRFNVHLALKLLAVHNVLATVPADRSARIR